MSTSTRKLGYYSFEFVRTNGEHFFSNVLFLQFIEYLNALPADTQILRIENSNKALMLDFLRTRIFNGITYVNMVFKSCKYNHTPSLMSSLDGSERPSGKTLDEGDKEITHLCMRLDINEAYTVLEERRSGVAIGTIVKYLNRHFLQFHPTDDDGRFYIGSSFVPVESFLDALRKMRRIKIAEIHTHKEVLGSGYLEMVNPTAEIQDDLVISAKAVNRRSIGIPWIEDLFRSISNSGTITKRIRIYGKDESNMSVVLDSLHSRRTEEVIVNIREEDGIVDSAAMFSRIEEALGITE